MRYLFLKYLDIECCLLWVMVMVEVGLAVSMQTTQMHVKHLTRDSKL